MKIHAFISNPVNRRRAEVVSIVVIALAWFIYAALSSHIGIGALSSDFFREISIAQRLANGETLYSDVHYAFGPLMPYVNALLVSLFGLGALYWSGLFLLSIMLVALALIALRWKNGFLSLCMMSLLLGIYFLYGPILFPYSFPSVAEICLIVWIAFLLDHPTSRRHRLRGAIVGILLLLNFLCRPHSAALYSVGILTWLIFSKEWRLLRNALLWGFGAGSICLGFFAAIDFLAPFWWNMTNDFVVHGQFQVIDTTTSFLRSITFQHPGLVGFENSIITWLMIGTGVIAAFGLVYSIVTKRPVSAGTLLAAITLPTLYGTSAILRRFPVLVVGAMNFLSMASGKRSAQLIAAAATLITLFSFGILAQNKVENYLSYNKVVTIGNTTYRAPGYTPMLKSLQSTQDLYRRYQPQISQCSSIFAVGKQAQVAVIESGLVSRNPVTVYGYNLFHDDQLAEQLSKRIREEESMCVFIVLDSGFLNLSGITQKEFWDSKIGLALKNATTDIWHSPENGTILIGSTD